jgi:Leu/Phe-tRNA-protein transferase
MVYTDMQHDYYVSDNWNVEFYVIQAIRGFIAVGHSIDDAKQVLLPQIQYSYCVFDFSKIYIHHRMIKRIRRMHGWKICVNRDFRGTVDKINEYHSKIWLTSEYRSLAIHLNQCGSLILSLPGILEEHAFRMCSVELYDDSDNLVAGELGYTIGCVFTSLTGFCKREKRVSIGKIQILCMARILEIAGFEFLNLGQPPQNGHMQYKEELGGVEVSRSDFLERWKPAISHVPVNNNVFFDCYRSISDLFP